MRVALYARVSTADKDQNPDTQLYRLRDFVSSRGYTVSDEYVDTASATDFGHRTEWARLLKDGASRKFDTVLVFKLDRAFRSVKHMHDTLAVWEPLGVGFLSAQEGFDTSTALGRLLLNLLASLAEFELELIRERVVAGMERAKRQGRMIGRPPALHRPGLEQEWEKVRPLIEHGRISVRQASRRLGVGTATVYRLRSQSRG